MNTNDLGLLPSNQQPQDVWQNIPSEWVDNGNSEMYKKTIEALMDKVTSKYWELNSIKFSTSNQNAAQKNDILKTVFEAMKTAGIDPSDWAAVNQFMAQLEQENPDLFELFNEAMDTLLWPDPNSEQSVDLQQSQDNQPLMWDTSWLNQPWTVTESEDILPSPQSPADPTQSPM